MPSPSPSRRSDVDFVFEQVRRHHAWFDACLPMIASENLISPLARQLLVSDFHDRYAEGHPGKRYYQGLAFIDEVERRCAELARELFGCSHADVRPTSGTNANMAAFFALAQPGDAITALGTASGGHISHAKFGSAGQRGLAIHTYPWNDREMNLEVEGAKKLIREVRPKVVVLGGSVFLFPHPVSEIAPVAREVGARVMYDGAHVLGLIAGGRFQDPLREGADVMTGSTHKTLPGPQGAVLLSNLDDSEENAKLKKKLDSAVFPGVVSSHHLHHMAAKAVTFAEHLEFGRDYASQVVANAKALGQALHEEGVKVLCEHKGFTESHQVVVDVREHGGGKWAAEALERGNVITNMNMLPGDEKPMNPSGLRLGSQELTRIGLRPADMGDVARFVRQVVVDKVAPEKVRADVAEFRKGFRGVRYCFEEGTPAYEFWTLAVK
ncbi:MAG TPA: serine hydroxymethyltransferase [Candidatus Thermoplasmatota archaeon]|nr:serine hydroxymethyltransferase [Candidatus Thermoplasmatota archaeon]